LITVAMVGGLISVTELLSRVVTATFPAI
jgi:hypothetical protein